MDNQYTQILRLMAWERAKGELKSMLQTYINEQEQYEELEKAIEEFIKDVEDKGKYD